MDACAAEPPPADPAAVLVTDADGMLPLDATRRDVVVLEAQVAPAGPLAPVTTPTGDGTDPAALGAALADVLDADVPVLGTDAVRALAPRDATDGTDEDATAATEHAAEADRVAPLVVVPLPGVEAQDEAAGDAGDLVATLAAAGLDVALVADRSATPRLAAAVLDAAATLLVDRAAGAADVAALLTGARTPAGTLTEPVAMPAGPAAAPGAPRSGVTLDDGHGLTYWRFGLRTAEAARDAAGALAVRAEVDATGTAPGSAAVSVEGRTSPGAPWLALGCVDARPEPGTTAVVELTVEVTAELPVAATVTRVRVTTPDDELVVDVRGATAPGRPTAPGAPGEPVEPGEPSDPAVPADDPEPADRAPSEAPADDAVGREPVRAPAPDGAAADPEGTGRIPLRAVIPGPTGGLRLTVADGGLVLADPKRLPDRWHLAGALPAITVTDARDDAVGWSVSVRAAALTTGPAGSSPARSV